MFIPLSVLWNKSIRGLLYISAWASALLVQTTTGSSKASNSGTSNRYRFPRFFFYSITYLINEPFGSGICWLFWVNYGKCNRRFQEIPCACYLYISNPASVTLILEKIINNILVILKKYICNMFYYFSLEVSFI